MTTTTSTRQLKSPHGEPPAFQCPFTVQIDTREQLGYKFAGSWETPIKQAKLIRLAPRGKVAKRMEIPTVVDTVPVGDYSIVGMLDRITIERKSKGDLYSSISQARENFIERLEKMSRYEFAAVMIEAGWLELLTDPPKHTDYKPKSLSRTIFAWMTRYQVHWITAPSRAHAEVMTFRLLERFWIDHHERPRERFDPGLLAEPLPDPDDEDTSPEAGA